MTEAWLMLLVVVGILSLIIHALVRNFWVALGVIGLLSGALLVGCGAVIAIRENIHINFGFLPITILAWNLYVAPIAFVGGLPFVLFRGRNSLSLTVFDRVLGD